MDKATTIGYGTGALVLAGGTKLATDLGANVGVKLITKALSSSKPVVQALGGVGGFSLGCVIGGALSVVAYWCAISATNGAYNLIDEAEEQLKK